jgi:hypothetical protein
MKKWLKNLISNGKRRAKIEVMLQPEEESFALLLCFPRFIHFERIRALFIFASSLCCSHTTTIFIPKITRKKSEFASSHEPYANFPLPRLTLQSSQLRRRTGRRRRQRRFI